MEHPNQSIRNLFASDLDGTLIPVKVDPAHQGAVARLRERLADHADLRIAYVSGRSQADTLEAVAEFGLPHPDALCCDVGTRVLWWREEAWRLDEDYHRHTLDALGRATADEVLAVMTAETHFTPQEPAHQTPVKMSFYLGEKHDALEELEAARGLMRRSGWTLSLVASRCVYTGRTLLDVLPGGIDKATAVHHLRKRLGLETRAVVYAGDSGNDLAPLTAGFRAIVVANATRDLAGRIVEFAADEGRPERVHLSERPHLHGVLEGAEHFGVF